MPVFLARYTRHNAYQHSPADHHGHTDQYCHVSGNLDAFKYVPSISSLLSPSPTCTSMLPLCIVLLWLSAGRWGGIARCSAIFSQFYVGRDTENSEPPVQKCCSLRLREDWLRHRNFFYFFAFFSQFFTKFSRFFAIGLKTP